MSRFEVLGLQKEVQLPQGIIRYRECGSGEPIVFIHGLLVNGDLWRKVVPQLSQKYRCIVPDLPLGAHEVALEPEADLTPPGMAKLIANFVEALDLAPVTLVGSDTGGAFCQLAITAYPQYFSRLILTNCDAYQNFLPLLVRPFQWVGHFMPLLTSLVSLDARLKRPLILRFVTKHPVERTAVQSYLEPIINNRTIQQDLGKVLRGISNRYTKAAATKFTQFDKPVLIVWANEDFLFPVKDAQKMAKAFPNVRLEYISDSFAFISEDQPQHLTQLIEIFMDSGVLV